MVTNLLSNAVKFTPEGGSVHLEATLADESDGNCTLQIEVFDSGIGISPEKHEKLFQAFEQAESGTSRDYGGTGLGLVIHRKGAARQQKPPVAAGPRRELEERAGFSR